jgi:hypothetical protein
VILAPSTPYPAFPIGQGWIEVNGARLPAAGHLGVYTQPLSFAGLPTVAAPVASAGVLPLGVQIVAAPWREDLAFRVGAAAEAPGAVGSAPVTPIWEAQHGRDSAAVCLKPCGQSPKPLTNLSPQRGGERGRGPTCLRGRLRDGISGVTEPRLAVPSPRLFAGRGRVRGPGDWPRGPGSTRSSRRDVRCESDNRESGYPGATMRRRWALRRSRKGETPRATWPPGFPRSRE